MAATTGIPGSGKRPSYRENMTTYVRRGRLIYAKFRKKQGKPTSAITREQNEWFRQANTLAKYAPSDDQWMAIEVTKNGPWYPRDLLMSAMKGRLFESLIIDGKEYRSVAVIEDVSSDLDFLAGTVVGTIIVRDTDRWKGLIPTTAGLQLTSNGPDAMPSWQPAGGADAAYLTHMTPKTIFSGSSNAFKGFPFVAGQDFTLAGVGGLVNATSGHLYKGWLMEFSVAGAVTAILGETGVYESTSTERKRLFAEFITPALMVKGARYVMGWSRVDGADTFVFPFGTALVPTVFPGLPVDWFILSSNVSDSLVIPKASPQVGDTVTLGSGASFYLEALVLL